MSLEISPSEFSLGDDERISINREIKEGLLKKYPYALVKMELPSGNETVALFPGIDENLSLNVGYEKDITEISYKDYGVIHENYHHKEEDAVFAFEHSRVMIFSDQGLIVFPQGEGKYFLDTANLVAVMFRIITEELKWNDGSAYIDCKYYPLGVGSLNKEEQKDISSILKINNILNRLINDIKTEKQKEIDKKNRKMKEDPKGFIKKILRNI